MTTSPDLRLLPITEALGAVLSRSTEDFQRDFAVRLGPAVESVRQVVAGTLSMPPAPPPWIGYLAREESGGEVVGTCAFKSAPSSEGIVEIAYYTFPFFEGRGYASAMARHLLQIAWTDPSVRTVLAHTLPEENASTRILQKLGFIHEGPVSDPEDGAVWRWKLSGRPPRPGDSRA